MKIAILLLAVVLVAGCTQPQAPITEITIEGHGSQIYTFAHDIRQSLLVKTNDTEGIMAIGRTFDHMNIVFNGLNTQQNAYFRITILNFMAKVPIYYSYEGRLVTFDSYYFFEDEWYNSTGGQIEKPVFEDPVIWLQGPADINETSLVLQNNTIFLNGDSYNGLTMAGDKLALLFFGIDSI